MNDSSDQHRRPARPPVHSWLAYRLFGARVPYQYRDWVRADAQGRWFRVRQTTGAIFVPFLAPLLAWSLVTAQIWAEEGRLVHPPFAEYWWWPLLHFGLFIVRVVVPIPPLDRRARRWILRRHDFHEDGTPIIYGPQLPPPAPGWRFRS